MISFHVPAMSSRHSVRAISARVCDVVGVRTVEADLVSRTVQVTGSADPADVLAAVAAAGYAVDPRVPAGSSTAAPHTEGSDMGTPINATGTDAFSTDPTGLPEAVPTATLEFEDGDVLDLRMGPVAKRLAGTTVRMLGYNGSVPGPTITVRQGERLTVRATNDADLDTTVHWHGLRLENRYDGVPYDTQQPIAPGESFTYRLEFPDPGLYWYHPHIREDYTQEMGLYGNILVLPADPDYWPPAHRDVVLTLDDVLIDDGVIATFSRSEITHAAMGRFGNVILVGGETDQAFTAQPGEVVRLWLTNTANARVFSVHLPGARMKLVGGDSGRVEHEEFVSDVLIAPSERVIVDVLFERAGSLHARAPDPGPHVPARHDHRRRRARRAVAAQFVRGPAARARTGGRTRTARRLARRAARQDPRRGRGDGRHRRSGVRRARRVRLPHAPRGRQRRARPLPHVRDEADGRDGAGLRLPDASRRDE